MVWMVWEISWLWTGTIHPQAALEKWLIIAAQYGVTSLVSLPEFLDCRTLFICGKTVLVIKR